MKQEAFNRAQQLYDKIHTAQCDIKDIKYYEQKHYKAGVPLILKVPYIIGQYSVDSVDRNVGIVDKELIKEILNLIKIHSVKTIQNAEKELETL